MQPRSSLGDIMTQIDEYLADNPTKFIGACIAATTAIATVVSTTCTIATKVSETARTIKGHWSKGGALGIV